MLDLKWIRENPADFDQGLARRGAEPLSSTVLALDEELRAHKKALQDLQARRNAASKEIGKAKGKGGDPAKAEALMAEVAELKGAIAAGEAKERELDAGLTALLAGIPNMLLPAPEVPDGKDESENVELRRVGSPRDFTAEGFAPKQHFELGEALGLMDFEAAAKISGARFTVLKGQLARLERALGQFMLDVQTSEHGYTEVNPPLLVRDKALYGTAQLPKFSDDLFETSNVVRRQIEHLSLKIALLRPDIKKLEKYKVTSKSSRIEKLSSTIAKAIKTRKAQVEAAKLELKRLVDEHPSLSKHTRLIPTAEVPLTNLVRESILAEADLPLRFTALTPCFRAEAGAAGRDTRGMIRQHQFYKVEMVSITTPEASPAEHARMTACAEEILKRLGLPYRVVVLCAGDTGFGSRKTHDIEVWLPGQGAYREISSVSNCGDFQARRMQARFRAKDAKDVQFVHTLNGSGLAVGRALIAVIENYQEADGGVRVPDALLPYMGGITRIGV
ncbi:serine--tRNA ligase [Rhodomicrobium lacus]|uniref:serine--tRNA ligase n=1 Tax=Rhodomicrobium lacus TaxID=2498452 RepID=UPI0026E1C667|nr:serine--tRNA ligase [Rhodomicrobium lacus]WKW52277.1 serine--tRNA ligase [Rhodomicrobium lacus]